VRHRKRSGRFFAFRTKLGGTGASSRSLHKGVIAPDSAEIVPAPSGNRLPATVIFSNNQTTVAVESLHESEAFVSDRRLAWSLHHGPREVLPKSA
jgi:hypothetical protein